MLALLIHAQRGIRLGVVLHCPEGMLGPNRRLFSLLFVMMLMTTGCMDPQLRRTNVPPPPASVASARVDCVEIHTTLVDDETIPLASTLINYEFENRCTLAATVDWTRVTATGLAVTSANKNEPSPSFPLTVHDPNGHVHIARLDGERSGYEALRYDAKDPNTRFNRVCLDMSRVVVGANVERIVCIDRPGDPDVITKQWPGATEAHDEPDKGYYQPRFGSFWDTTGLPRFRLEGGGSFHTMGLAGRNVSLPNSAIQIPGEKIGRRLTAGTFDMRMSGFISGPLYVGGEMDLGFGGARATATADPQISLTNSVSGHMVFAAFVGVTKRVGRVQPHAELDLGGRIIFLATNVNCPDSGCTSGGTTAATAAWWIVTPRAGLDVWIHPNITLGAYARFDALQTSDVTAGLSIGIHMRTFDGR